MILRHKIKFLSEDLFSEYSTIENRLPKILATLKDNPQKISLGTALNLEFRAISNAIVLGLDKEKVYLHLFYALQFGTNHFKLAMHPGQEVELTIGETRVKAIGKETRDYVHFGHWQMLAYLALMLRDREAYSFLQDVSNDFMKRSNVSFDDVDIAVVNVMKQLGNKVKLKGEIDTYWSTVESMGKYGRKNFNMYLTDCMVSVFEAVAANDIDLFNERIEKGLQKHWEFYEDESRGLGIPGDPWSWISFMLTTGAAYGYDQGLEIKVESDYLPKWIVEGDFKDCHLTVK